MASGPNAPFRRQWRASRLVVGRLRRSWSRHRASERCRVRWSRSPLSSNRRRGSSSMTRPSCWPRCSYGEAHVRGRRGEVGSSERGEQHVDREFGELCGRWQRAAVLDVGDPRRLADCSPSASHRTSRYAGQHFVGKVDRPAIGRTAVAPLVGGRAARGPAGAAHLPDVGQSSADQARASTRQGVACSDSALREPKRKHRSRRLVLIRDRFPLLRRRDRSPRRSGRATAGAWRSSTRQGSRSRDSARGARGRR